MLKFKKKAQKADAIIANYKENKITLLFSSQDLTTRPGVYSKLITFEMSIKNGTEIASKSDDNGA